MSIEIRSAKLISALLLTFIISGVKERNGGIVTWNVWNLNDKDS